MDAQQPNTRESDIVGGGQKEVDDLLFAQKMAEIGLRAMPSTAPLNPSLLLRKEAKCKDYDDLSDDDEADAEEEENVKEEKPSAAVAPIVSEIKTEERISGDLSKPEEYQKEKSMLDSVIAGNKLDVIEDDSDIGDEEEEGETIIGSLSALEDTIPEEEEIRKIGSIHSVVEKCIVVRGDDIASSDMALDVESVLCDQNRRVIGMIVETFGQTAAPMYLVYPKEGFNAAQLALERDTIGPPVYAVVSRIKMVSIEDDWNHDTGGNAIADGRADSDDDMESPPRAISNTPAFDAEAHMRDLPPPAVSKGRGKGKGKGASSNHGKSHSESSGYGKGGWEGWSGPSWEWNSPMPWAPAPSLNYWNDYSGKGNYGKGWYEGKGKGYTGEKGAPGSDLGKGWYEGNGKGYTGENGASRSDLGKGWYEGNGKGYTGENGAPRSDLGKGWYEGKGKGYNGENGAPRSDLGKGWYEGSNSKGGWGGGKGNQWGTWWSGSPQQEWWGW